MLGSPPCRSLRLPSCSGLCARPAGSPFTGPASFRQVFPSVTTWMLPAPKPKASWARSENPAIQGPWVGCKHLFPAHLSHPANPSSALPITGRSPKRQPYLKRSEHAAGSAGKRLVYFTSFASCSRPPRRSFLGLCCSFHCAPCPALPRLRPHTAPRAHTAP